MLGIWNALPLKVQKAVTDFWTTFLVGIAGLTIVVPSSDYKDWAIAVGLAVGSVAVNALRRALAGYFFGA
jgi:TctA family transporter